MTIFPGRRSFAPTRFARLTLALAVAAITLAAAPVPTQIYKHFTLIDGRGGPAEPDAAMAVSNGRILWVGRAADVPTRAWPDARMIDLSGKYVIPGLIDTHVHIGNTEGLVQDGKFYTRANVDKDLKQYAAYGVTSVAVMGTDKDLIFQIRKEQHEAPPLAARVHTAGQGIVFRNGYGGVAGINHPVSTPDEAVAEVRAQADKGADYIKVWLDDELGSMPKMPPEISQAVITEAHRRGLRVFAHVFYLEDARRLVDQGIDGFVHTVRDQPIDDALIADMIRHGTVQEAGTLSREDSLVEFGRDAPEFRDPFFQQAMSAETLASLRSIQRRDSIAKSPNYPKLQQFDTNARANLMRLVRAGVPFGVGTDSGPPGRFAGYFLHWELAEMVKAGITPAQAIHAATGGSAAILEDCDIGTLQQAKWADFVVLDADPLRDILNTRKISAVYIAGQRVPSVRP